ncbi:hypothetical protein [Defluviimonas salinarum]|uniref:Uncharacterized protein n=1 Tax=Defluviimonas salinarum TaxID=2992147 RepID=A0ABT3J919_9RHOB|nr:hypothetical protein [Defluviimonas salinarum]MCW3784184.1 hypothetical protein [Defluviimonas salinarum]
MTSQDNETLHHLSKAAHNLELAGYPGDAEVVRERCRALRDRIEDEARTRRRAERNAILTQADRDEMACFGVRFGEIHWLPATLNLYEYDLQAWRHFESLAERRSTRRTRKFGHDVRRLKYPGAVLDAGWTGFVVRIEIAHSEQDYGYVPHWSDVWLADVYVDQLPQALRLARVLRDRFVIENAREEGSRVDPRYLWTEYRKYRKHRRLPIEI